MVFFFWHFSYIFSMHLTNIITSIISLLILAAFIVSFIFYISKWAEAHMVFTTQLIQIYSVAILFLSVLLFFSDHCIPAALFSTTSNSLWTYILFTGFPFISPTQPSFILAILSTILSHFGWLIEFFDVDYGPAFSLFSFFLYVWLIPIMILSSMSAIDDLSNNKKGHSAWTNVFKTLIEKSQKYIPHFSSKLE